jgi:hypothetical protein
LAVERSVEALALDSRVVDVGALCANDSAGSVANRATAIPDTNGGRLMTYLGKGKGSGGSKMYRPGQQPVIAALIEAI